MSAPNPYDEIWSHIDQCAECDRDLRRLCKTGQQRLDQATQSAAARIAPMPWVLGKGQA